MPAIFEIYSPEGDLRYRLGQRLQKMFGVAMVGNSYTGVQASGVINHGWFTAFPGTVPFAHAIAGQIDLQGNTCTFAFSGNSLTWRFPNADPGKPWTRPDTVFAYGIY